VRIVDLRKDDLRSVEQAAALWLEGFADTGSTSWHTRDQALLSVKESLGRGVSAASPWRTRNEEPSVAM
jgi:hypothetical protein